VVVVVVVAAAAAAAVVVLTVLTCVTWLALPSQLHCVRRTAVAVALATV
jgi:hypothetical protein